MPPGSGCTGRWDGAQTIIQVVLVIVTAIYCGASLTLLGEMKKQNDLTRQNLVAIQRAWVSVKGGPSDPGELAPERRVVQLVVHNSGKTPAMNVRRQTVAQIIAGPAATPPAVSFAGPATQGVIAEGQDLTARTGLGPFSRQDLDAVAAGKSTLYLHGRVDFDDIFGHAHWLTLCYFYTREAEGHWRLCPAGNGTDSHENESVTGTKRGG
jgi:hypothetical protein